MGGLFGPPLLSNRARTHLRAAEKDLTLPSPLAEGEEEGEPHRRSLAASRAAALIQLVLVCASYEGRSRALFNDTATRATGRSDGRDREVWMGCRA